MCGPHDSAQCGCTVGMPIHSVFKRTPNPAVLQIENADFYIRKKDVSKASAGLAEAKTALDTVLSKLV